MKKIMFGNSLMLLGIAIMILAGLEVNIYRSNVGFVSFNHRRFYYGCMGLLQQR